jgi:hypothetical protein
MSTYTINFVNNSGTAGSFCVFQQSPNYQDPGVFPLAWLVQSAVPYPNLSISWKTDLCFVWGITGQLAPGVIFNASKSLPADTHKEGGVAFDIYNGNYQFIKTNIHPQGMLMIIVEYNIPVNQASVGIGMSGAGTFAAQAQTNVTYTFEPDPGYWVTFGDFKQGQVLGPSDMNNAPQIIFPHGIFSMNVTLNATNTWTITPG